MRYERLKVLKAQLEQYVETEGLDIEKMQPLLEVYNYTVSELNKLDRELNEHTI